MKSGFSQDTLELILARSQGQCEIMSQVCSFHVSDVHHRRPRGMGGTNEPSANLASNGIAVCRRCHMWTESQRTWALENGFILKQGMTDPQEAAIWWRCNRTDFGNAAKVWCLLLNDGSRKIIGNEDITTFTW